MMKTQSIVNFCVRCESRFPEWSAYHSHVVANKCTPKIVPINTSGRTKMEIVRDWEKQNKGAIIQ